MKILYLDLGMGAAGDMLSGALLGLLPTAEREAFLQKLNAALPEGVCAAAVPAQQCGITGWHFSVRVNGVEEQPGGSAQDHSDHAHAHDHDHAHAHDHDHAHTHEHSHSHVHPGSIAALVARMPLDAETKAAVLRVYGAIAAAESEVHGMPVEEVHLHELGALDAVADITAAVLLLRALAPDRIVASPVAVGSGTVRCAHGLMPVPAPATALLLRGIPSLAGTVEGELCTPTGAALIGQFAAQFGPMPAMIPNQIGYGFGTKTFSERPNCVRAVLWETFEAEAQGGEEEILQLQCDLDDMTPEAIGFAREQIEAAGAVEVFTTPADMKKNRPGVLLTVLCHAPQRDAVLRAIFAHTRTLGVRGAVMTRWTLTRKLETVETALGPVRRKTARGYGTETSKWEYEDLARLARERGMTLEAVRQALDGDGCAE